MKHKKKIILTALALFTLSSTALTPAEVTFSISPQIATTNIDIQNGYDLTIPKVGFTAIQDRTLNYNIRNLKMVGIGLQTDLEFDRLSLRLSIMPRYGNLSAKDRCYVPKGKNYQITDITGDILNEESFISADTNYTGTKAKLASLEGSFCLAYRLIDQSKLSISPYIGISSSYEKISSRSNFEAKLKERIHSFLLGIELNAKPTEKITFSFTTEYHPLTSYYQQTDVNFKNRPGNAAPFEKERIITTVKQGSFKGGKGSYYRWRSELGFSHELSANSSWGLAVCYELKKLRDKRSPHIEFGLYPGETITPKPLKVSHRTLGIHLNFNHRF